ncbi:hypothetical protein EMCRGX_G007142 [Ephydatia muelleri]|eukprot:Em0002g1299a
MPFPPQHYRQHPFHQVPRWQQSRGCAVNQPLLTYQTQLAFQPFPPPPNQAFYESAAHRPSGSDPFLLEWMERVRSTKPQSSPHSPPLKIPEVRQKLCRAADLLQLLRSLHAQLASVQSSDGVCWSLAMEEVARAKQELQEIKALFESTKTMDVIAKKLQDTRARRARKRVGVKKRREEVHSRRAQTEQSASQWLEERRSQELRRKTEATVQRSASGVLGEVRRKMSDIQQSTRLLATLKELRDLRRDASRKKGNAPPVEEDERFDVVCTSLHSLLASQGSVYQREEHALRVLMKEEVMEKMERSKKQAAPPPVEDKPVESSPSQEHPMTLSEYYLQADQSVDALVAIRCEWDKFLSPHGHPVPSGEVCPPLPSSVMWEQYLQKRA